MELFELFFGRMVEGIAEPLIALAAMVLNGPPVK
jgi:hypothetical protein